MPPSNPVPKRSRPFKPPQPSTKPTKTPKTKQPPTRRKSAPAKQTQIDAAAAASSSSSSELASSPSPPATLDPPPTIPPALLTRLLHHHFQDSKTRIGKEANGVVGKYMETFVREAIARAAFERREAGGTGMEGGFLEVEDLEKLAPQLLLDF